MRQSTWIAILVASGIVALAGCQRVETAKTNQSERRAGREPVRVISKLDCPENQGSLKRISVAEDGLSCAYAGVDAEVLLRLVSLDGGPAEDALAPIETDLKTLMPSVAPVAEPKTGQGRDRNKTSIHLPGVRIDASDGGSDIKIGNITIHSNEGGASEVKINENVTGRIEETDDDAVSIRASDDGAEVRHSKRGDSIRSTLILASDKATSGYRVVGYEARGPKEGPLAIATIKAKNRDSGDHDVFNDMKALVRHNVGG